MSKGIFKNVTRSYRPHFALGFIKASVNLALDCDDAKIYQAEMLKIKALFEEYELEEQKDQEYMGIF